MSDILVTFLQAGPAGRRPPPHDLAVGRVVERSNPGWWFEAGFRRLEHDDLRFGDRSCCHCEPTGRSNARPMTGSAKQSSFVLPQEGTGLLRRFAPRNDDSTKS